jgi:hypothetical protein
MSARNVEVKFMDKFFRVRVYRENETAQTLWLKGTEARHLFNALDVAINTRPRSEDDRIDLESRAPKPE